MSAEPRHLRPASGTASGAASAAPATPATPATPSGWVGWAASSRAADAVTSTVQPAAAPAALRDPAVALAELRRAWRPHAQWWVFGYASLIWRPEFEAVEHRPALLRGWHRALRMRSRINRGTPEQPGLVFALLPGGACRGMVYRLRAETAEQELERLWAREMPTGVYDPRLVSCRTCEGPVVALAFTLSRRSEACLPRLAEGELLRILRHARGRYGTTLEYLAETAAALRAHGMLDREVERMVALASRHGLL